MKESISYAFILNIMITFIFMCFAVIMGIFSYYRAFRANTAILNSLEKYEGYNCLSIAEIDKTLKQIGYNTPFAANKKSDGKGELITYSIDAISKGFMIGETSELKAILPETQSSGKQWKNYGTIGYSILYYNYTNDNLKTRININNKNVDDEYQFGVFTYMYMDFPIVNNLFKVPVYGKTNIIQEFRDIVEYTDEDKAAYLAGDSKRQEALNKYLNENAGKKARYESEVLEYDRRLLLSEGNITLTDFGFGESDTDNSIVNDVLRLSAMNGTTVNFVIEARTLYKGDVNGDGKINAKDKNEALLGNITATKKNACGTFINYKVYGGVIE